MNNNQVPQELLDLVDTDIDQPHTFVQSKIAPKVSFKVRDGWIEDYKQFFVNESNTYTQEDSDFLKKVITKVSPIEPNQTTAVFSNIQNRHLIPAIGNRLRFKTHTREKYMVTTLEGLVNSIDAKESDDMLVAPTLYVVVPAGSIITPYKLNKLIFLSEERKLDYQDKNTFILFKYNNKSDKDELIKLVKPFNDYYSEDGYKRIRTQDKEDLK